MTKILLPAGIAIVGLGIGLGAGVAFRPAPEIVPAAQAEACDGEGCDGAEVVAAAAQAPAGWESVAIERPFVVPIFDDNRIVAMVVLSLALEVGSGQSDTVDRLEPRLRDGLLATMFRHANSGGFEGSFTAGQKMADLKSALLLAARDVLGGVPVGEVLVTEIVRQDV